MSKGNFDAAGHVTSPAKRGFDITPNDSADFSVNTRMLYIGGTGSVKLEMEDDPVGTFVTLNAIPAGSALPLAIRKIYSTGTTATLMVGFY